MFAKVRDAVIVELPYDLRANHTERIWPADLSSLTQEDLPEGVVRVIDVQRPLENLTTVIDAGYKYDETTHTCNRNWVVEPLSTNAAKAKIRTAVTAKRWLVETAGIVLSTGIKIKTDLESQSRLNNLLQGSKRRRLTNVRFKDANEKWVDLDLVRLEEINDEVFLYGQECFAAEQEHHLAIDAIEPTPNATVIEQLRVYDIHKGWPSNLI